VILRTILLEIKNRYRAEEALSASEKTARALLDGIKNSAYLIDPAGIILDINATAAKRAGKTASQMVGSCLWSHYGPPEISRQRRLKAEQALASGEEVRFEDQRNGRIFDHTYYPISNAVGEAVRLAVLAVDVTAQQKVLESLKASEKRFRTLIEDAPIGISMSSDLYYTYANRAYTRIFGFGDPSELVGTYIGGRIAPQCRDEINDLALLCSDGEKSPCEYETTGMRKDRVQFPCYVVITRLIFDDGPVSVSFVRDLTEQKQARELLIQADKMAMIGSLAAGMAHEINNPIGIIIQNLQNIERRLSLDFSDNHDAAEESGVSLVQVRGYLEKRSILRLLSKMFIAGERTTKIVANMLQFSRRNSAEHKSAALAEIIERAVELAANDYDLKKKYDFGNIKVVRDFAADLPQVPVNATEFEQVMINLLKNAAQAFPASAASNPQISLSTYREDQMAVVKVSDNGQGMDEGTCKRIFEPFFSTKEVGAGTGLGLSVSYTLITQNHKGSFTVDSSPGEGTCFTIKLPL
jgi:PAS domain S-box-containing protein